MVLHEENYIKIFACSNSLSYTEKQIVLKHVFRQMKSKTQIENYLWYP